jgi:hypothetical protein
MADIQLLWIRGIVKWHKEANTDCTWYGYLDTYNWIAHVADGEDPVDFWSRGAKSDKYIWVRKWVDEESVGAAVGSGSDDSDSDSSGQSSDTH